MSDIENVTYLPTLEEFSGLMKLGLAVPEGSPGWRTTKGPVPSNQSGFRACGHRVLLIGQQKEEYAVSTGGIMLPTATQQKEQQHQVIATVVEIGPDCWSDLSTDFCKVGDKVLVGQYVGKFHDSPCLLYTSPSPRDA